jgi:hypothetical protein
MKNHIKILGRAYLAFGVLGLVVAAGFINALTSPGFTPRSLLPLSTAGFGAILAALFTLTSVPSLIGGGALLLQQSWARMLVLILGYVNLCNVPLGTILGIYTIWVISSEKDTQISDTDAVVEKDMPRVFPPYH